MNISVSKSSLSPVSPGTDATLSVKPFSNDRAQSGGAIPWLLFGVLWAVLFPVFDQFGSTSYPYDYESVSSVTAAAQSGDLMNRVCITVLGLVGAILLSRRRRAIKLEPLMCSLLAAFLVLNGMSALWSSDPPLTIRRLVSLGLTVIFAAGFGSRMNAFLISLFLGGFQLVRLAAGLSFEVLTNRFHPFSTGYRFCGTAPHPNVEAAFLSVATMVFWWLYRKAAGVPKRWFLAATLMVGVFLVLTGSRSSLIAVVAALTFSCVLNFLRDHKQPLLILGATLSLLISLGLLAEFVLSTDAASSTLPAMMHRSDDADSLTELSGRLDLWKSLIPYVLRRPWEGYGFGGFWTPQRVEDVTSDQGWVIQQAHSGYLDQMLAVGIPGALLYVALLFCGILMQLMGRRPGRGVWVALLIFIGIHSATESTDISSSFTNLTFYIVVLDSVMIRKPIESLPAGVKTA